MKQNKKFPIKYIAVSLMVLFLCGVICVLQSFGEKDAVLADGEYQVSVQLEGGSGRAGVTSPTVVSVRDGKMYARIEWSSSNYDYMLVAGEKYLPVNKEGNSCFEIPVEKLDEKLSVVANTTAMSKPHEVAYEMTFSLLEGEKSALSNQNVTSGDETTLTETETEIPEQLGDSLQWDSKLALSYATGFSVDYYRDKNQEKDSLYKLITIYGDGQFLVTPVGTALSEESLSNLPKEIEVIQHPKQIYLAASQTMDMFVALEALDVLHFSAQEADGWCQEEARESMESGDILYAGKYATPDYELLIDKNCDFAIENTMIYHTPEVKEKLESFGIPVLVDRSSYEESPQGRAEWVKLYGALVDREEAALQSFDAQCALCEDGMERALKFEETPTVAFFYISPNGEAKVRNPGDYLPKMIEMAGGEYCFQNVGPEEESAATITLQMEEFYAAVKDVDYIIYNSTIVGELDSVSDLLETCEVLKDVRAVREGHVYCTVEDVYQSPMKFGIMIQDIQTMLLGDGELSYLYQLK